ncbi:hypothetical protein V8F20_010531 [Naviculisporaceae sp. PSN 640]
MEPKEPTKYAEPYEVYYDSQGRKVSDRWFGEKTAGEKRRLKDQAAQWVERQRDRPNKETDRLDKEKGSTPDTSKQRRRDGVGKGYEYISGEYETRARNNDDSMAGRYNEKTYSAHESANDDGATINELPKVEKSRGGRPREFEDGPRTNSQHARDQDRGRKSSPEYKSYHRDKSRPRKSHNHAEHHRTERPRDYEDQPAEHYERRVQAPQQSMDRRTDYPGDRKGHYRDKPRRYSETEEQYREDGREYERRRPSQQRGENRRHSSRGGSRMRSGSETVEIPRGTSHSSRSSRGQPSAASHRARSMQPNSRPGDRAYDYVDPPRYTNHLRPIPAYGPRFYSASAVEPTQIHHPKPQRYKAPPEWISAAQAPPPPLPAYGQAYTSDAYAGGGSEYQRRR